jgi:hypothetical protein
MITEYRIDIDVELTKIAGTRDRAKKSDENEFHGVKEGDYIIYAG